jgi:16S rRNA U516 pseudouridylate synthase RsuA-like enzyme
LNTINKEERIQKLVANYSKYSRREFEKFISAGDVTVNGVTATLGTKATLNDSIKLNGKRIKFIVKQDYFVLNKPKGYISERIDKYGRTVISLIPKSESRNLFTVGRLDVNTTGLIIVTNDGDLAQLVTKPSSHIKKVYIA